MLLALVHYLGSSPVKAQIRNRAVDEKCSEFFVYAGQDAVFMAACQVPHTTCNDSCETDKKKKKWY